MPLDVYNPDGYVVRVSESALIHIVMSGLEGYSVSHKGNRGHKTGIETYGLLFGHEVRMANGQALYSVELASVDTSARRTRDSVEPNEKALELKSDFLSSFFPQYDFLGDFHSHPHTEPPTRVLVKRLYEFSGYDRLHIEGLSNFWKKHDYRVGLVLTITRSNRRHDRPFESLNRSTVKFVMGNYLLLLKAHVAFLDEDDEEVTIADDEEVSLHCPSLVGLGQEYTEFGRGKGKYRLRHMCGKI